MSKLLLAGLAVMALNIPFGYWRAHVRRLSTQWFLAIHIPVVFVIALRFAMHLGFAWYSYVVLVSAFFLGQQSGSWIIRWTGRHCGHISSCLVMDLVRCTLHRDA